MVLDVMKTFRSGWVQFLHIKISYWNTLTHLKWLVFPYTLLHPGIWQICCFFRSECLSPSWQFGQVHATLRTLCFCMLSWLGSFCEELLSASWGFVVTTTLGVRGAAVAGVVVTWGITCHLLGSLGSCCICWPTASWGVAAVCWVITWTLPRPTTQK